MNTTTAQVIDLDLAREANFINELHARYSAAEKTTLAVAVEIGQHLIAVKASLKHGEFMPWVEANCLFKEAQCTRYMQAAKFIPEMNLPDSPAPTTIREAAKLGAKTRKPSAGARLTVMAGNAGGNAFCPKASRAMAQAVKAALGVPTLKEVLFNDPEVCAKVQAVLDTSAGKTLDERRAVHEVEKRALPEGAKEKLARLIERERELLAQEFDVRVRKAADALIPERIAFFEEKSERAGKEFHSWALRSSGIKGQLTEEQYRFLLNALHPDREPNREKLTECFVIVRQFGEYAESFKTFLGRLPR